MAAGQQVGAAGGLSTREAASRLSAHGPNQLPEQPRRSVVARIAAQLRDPMIMLLLAAGLITTLIGDKADTAVIAIVVVLNTTIGVAQELRAEKAIAALNRMSAPRAHVLRDGQLTEIPAAQVVPGDVVHLEAGDVIAADAGVDEAYELQIDEAAMTGESVPVERSAGQEVLAGTVVTRGRAFATVTRTGAESGLGRIAALIASAPVRPTPLQQRLNKLSRILVVAVLVLAGVVMLLGLLRGRDPIDMLVVAVSLAVAAVPESLPAVVSVALALGAHRMARRSAVVRRLPAVETLGSVTVMASDKTGTLTEGRMVVEEVWTPGAGSSRVTGSGYAPVGEIVTGTGDDLDRLLRDVVLCNDARLLPPTDGSDWAAAGDPLEAALLALAAKGGHDPAAIRAAWSRRTELPFDSQRRTMTTLQHHPDDGWLVTTKGAPEVVLERVVEPGPATDAARTAADRLAEGGYRVLAVADRAYPTPPGNLDAGLDLVGLVAIADPPRSSARAVVDECRAAGIRLVLITGDHRATASAVADRLGIRDEAPDVADGDEVARGDHVDRVDHIGVYARTRPEQKVDIITALQDHGHVVAMTGDGVNDAPALRRADIGVAMGKGGTEVARQAAALVLADDDLHTVVAAVQEGRRIFANIRAFLRYAISGGFAEIAVMLVAPFLGMPIPLLPAQILWVNMLTHGLPGVAFGAEPLDPAVMTEPSRSPRESVLGEGLWQQIAATGTLIAAVSTGAGLWADNTGGHVQSWIFLTLGLAQLWVALALRARIPHRTIHQRSLEAAVLAAAVLQIAGVYLPPLQSLLGTEPVGGGTLLALTAVAAIPAAVIRISAHRTKEVRRA